MIYSASQQRVKLPVINRICPYPSYITGCIVMLEFFSIKYHTMSDVPTFLIWLTKFNVLIILYTEEPHDKPKNLFFVKFVKFVSTSLNVGGAAKMTSSKSNTQQTSINTKNRLFNEINSFILIFILIVIQSKHHTIINYASTIKMCIKIQSPVEQTSDGMKLYPPT